MMKQGCPLLSLVTLDLEVMDDVMRSSSEKLEV
jgi:hypothetical protein